MICDAFTSQSMIIVSLNYSRHEFKLMNRLHIFYVFEMYVTLKSQLLEYDLNDLICKIFYSFYLMRADSSK